MNQTPNVFGSLGAAAMKPEQIINNPDGTSTVLLPQGTAAESDPVIREFSGSNGTGSLLEQVINFNSGGSDVFIADPGVLAQIGQIGAVFGAGDVGSQLASIDIKFTGANGTGNATSGDVKTKDGDTYDFQLAGLPPGELVSVQEFSAAAQGGRLEETINVFTDGRIQFNMLAGSGLPSGVVSMQENFDMNGNLASVRTAESNGQVVVEALHYDASGNEISQTVETFNAQNQVVSSTTSAPSGPTPPKIGGEAAIQSIITALSSLNPPVPGTGVASSTGIAPQKVTLAASAH
ncbi:hypothetical protein [Paraburkholderia sp. 2C]|jgi:hypothetical protein